MSKTFDVYQSVTDQIVAAIEAGAGEARVPWQRGGTGGLLPVNASTAKPYNGINIVALWATGAARGYVHNTWATYRQWQDLGAQVKKGEKAAYIVFYKEFETEPKADDPNDDGLRRVARASTVFAADQVDGWTPPETGVPDIGPITRHARTDAILAAHAIDVRVGGDMAYYRPSTDHIQMPDESRFTGARREEDYYSVLWHEAGHWSGATSRLARDLTGRFGTAAYAMEELVAELTASFMCAELGISATPRADHSAYLANWLTVMKSDKKAIFTAAAKASEAARYLMSKAPA